MRALRRLPVGRLPVAAGSSRGLSTKRQSINITTTGPRTLYDKIWDDHVVTGKSDGQALIYIDRHLVHSSSLFYAIAPLHAHACRGVV